MPYPRRAFCGGSDGVRDGRASAVNLILFVSATFAASFVAGLAGFAFAIVAVAVWLHFLPPAQSTVLIAGFDLVVQG